MLVAQLHLEERCCTETSERGRALGVVGDVSVGNLHLGNVPYILLPLTAM